MQTWEPCKKCSLVIEWDTWGWFLTKKTSFGAAGTANIGFIAWQVFAETHMPQSYQLFYTRKVRKQNKSSYQPSDHSNMIEGICGGLFADAAATMLMFREACDLLPPYRRQTHIVQMGTVYGAVVFTWKESAPAPRHINRGVVA